MQRRQFLKNIILSSGVISLPILNVNGSSNTGRFVLGVFCDNRNRGLYPNGELIYFSGERDIWQVRKALDETFKEKEFSFPVRGEGSHIILWAHREGNDYNFDSHVKRAFNSSSCIIFSSIEEVKDFFLSRKSTPFNGGIACKITDQYYSEVYNREKERYYVVNLDTHEINPISKFIENKKDNRVYSGAWCRECGSDYIMDRNDYFECNCCKNRFLIIIRKTEYEYVEDHQRISKVF
jgi:hypothetical protein